MPFSSQAAISSLLIALDASLISVSPAQNRAKPSPVPGPSTEYWTSGFPAVKSSATMDVIGSTVDEPEITISPASPSPPSAGSEPSAPLRFGLLEQAARMRVAATVIASAGRSPVRGRFNASPPVRMAGCRVGLGWHRAHVDVPSLTDAA